MKTLQNNFTTPEQSKRLLELGVPAWTADCYYYEEGGISKDCTPNIVPLGEVWSDESKETMFSSYVDVPCWSVGRLMEIIDQCELQTSAYQNVEMHEDCNTTTLVDILAGETGREFDFSKLED